MKLLLHHYIGDKAFIPKEPPENCSKDLAKSINSFISMQEVNYSNNQAPIHMAIIPIHICDEPISSSSYWTFLYLEYRNDREAHLTAYYFDPLNNFAADFIEEAFLQTYRDVNINQCLLAI